MKKKLFFLAIVFLICSPLLWLFAEIIFRKAHGIPLTGGKLYESDMRMDEKVLEEAPWMEELLFRFQQSDNPILFYEPRPGFDDGLYRVNAAGFRDRDFPFEKDPDVFRIVILGDSIIWGHGLVHEMTFAKQLETVLNEELDRPFEVLNFGVSGYSTQQEVEMFRARASRYNPDLVIVGYCLNDYETSSVEGQVFRQLYHDIFSKSYVYDEIKARLSGVAFKTWGTANTDTQRQKDLREQFELLISYAGETPVVVVVFPVLIQFEDYPGLLQHHLIRQATLGLDLAYLDLLDVYKNYPAPDLVQNNHDYTHPNAYGTRIAVEATVETLLDDGLIPEEKDTPTESESESEEQ